MKTILAIILLAVSSAYVGASTECLSPPPVPPHLSSSPLPYKETQKRLNSLLKSKQLSDFYQELLAFSLQAEKKGWDEASDEEQYGGLLICFYVAKAPLIPFSYEQVVAQPRTQTGVSWDKSDITAKSGAVSSLLSLSYYDTSLFFKKKGDLGRLSAEYCAVILKCFREFYDPKLEENLKEAMAEINEKTVEEAREKWKPWLERSAKKRKTKGESFPLNEEERKEEEEQWKSCETAISQLETKRQGISLRMGVLERRNRDMPEIIEAKEREFLKMLVNYFPGKKGEVVKYIRMAGYRNDEISSLVDRTVGRDSKTEFLYKGRSRKDAR